MAAVLEGLKVIDLSWGVADRLAADPRLEDRCGSATGACERLAADPRLQE